MTAQLAERHSGYIYRTNPDRSNSGLLIVSRTTIDYTPKRYVRSPLASVTLHPATADHKPGDKVTKTKGEFDLFYAENGPYVVSVARVSHMMQFDI